MEGLIYDDLRSDPRVKAARRLLLEAYQEHRGHISTIRGPRTDRKISYAETVERLGRNRGRPLALAYLGSGLGNGALVELADGSIKYDMISGIGVHFLGHSAPALVATAFEAALRDTIMQGNLQQNEEALILSDRLLALANRNGACLAHCFLTTSGAMANENALKLMFQKRFPADRILAFEGCFAGRTLALSQITDRPGYRIGLPQTLAVDYLPFFDPNQPSRSIEQALKALERHLTRFPGRHAAMVFELVLGEGGCYPGDRSFFLPLLHRLRREGIIVMVDEVQTFGRTQQPFAFQHFELDSFVDVVTVGKLTQVCATLFRSELNPGPDLISQTFTGATAAILAGQAILEQLDTGGYYGPQGKIAELHNLFRSQLQALADRHSDRLRGPFGIGAMLAFTPFDGSGQAAKALVSVLFEEGVIAFSAGHDPFRIRFLPPVGAMDSRDVEQVMDILERALARTADDWGSRPAAAKGKLC